MQAGLGPKRLARRKTKHLVLPGPLRWQVGEASNPHAVGKPATDGRLDEIGSKESQRYRHVDFAHAALGAGGDALGRGRRILDQLLEPMAPLCNRSNQRPSRVRANGTPVLLRCVSGQKNFASLVRGVLVQGMWSVFVPSGSLPFAASVWFNSTIN